MLEPDVRMGHGYVCYITRSVTGSRLTFGYNLLYKELFKLFPLLLSKRCESPLTGGLMFFHYNRSFLAVAAEARYPKGARSSRRLHPGRILFLELNFGKLK